jgi:hypothetical protein
MYLLTFRHVKVLTYTVQWFHIHVEFKKATNLSTT